MAYIGHTLKNLRSLRRKLAILNSIEPQTEEAKRALKSYHRWAYIGTPICFCLACLLVALTFFSLPKDPYEGHKYIAYFKDGVYDEEKGYGVPVHVKIDGYNGKGYFWLYYDKEGNGAITGVMTAEEWEEVEKAHNVRFYIYCACVVFIFTTSAVLAVCLTKDWRRFWTEYEDHGYIPGEVLNKRT